MACNCGNTSICTQCSAGLPCNCPPDYSVAPQSVICGCCPDGYGYVGITPNFPNGECQCINRANCPSAISISAIPCTPCEDSVSSDCVFTPLIECLGALEGTTLTTLLQYFCSEAYILSQLQTIGLSVTLKAALCEIVSICPTVGSTTPILGPIIVTLP